jgi:MFS family permease
MAPVAATRDRTSRGVVVAVLGLLQILSWGSTFYLLAVLAKPITTETNWPYDRVMAGLSLGLLVAGAVSPRVGRAIARFGGRGVLACGALLIASGLVAVGTARHYAVYIMGWAVMGAGMGAGLYDAAFATLGWLYGKSARSAITAVTLYGGFASTVCWPLSAFLVQQLGWRGACLTLKSGMAWHGARNSDRSDYADELRGVLKEVASLSLGGDDRNCAAMKSTNARTLGVR